VIIFDAPEHGFDPLSGLKTDVHGFISYINKFTSYDWNQVALGVKSKIEPFVKTKFTLGKI